MKNEPTDEELLNAYFAGDGAAFELFFHRHAKRVIAYAMKRGIVREDAKDIAQEVFAKLDKKIHQYERGRAALPWFFVIVHHACLDYFRAQVRRKKGEGSYAESLAHEERGVTLKNADPYSTLEQGTQSNFQLLTKEQQEVVRMRVEEELSYETMALKVGKSEGSLKKLYQRALHSLRRSFAAKGKTDDE